ncbi:hypothetical protein EVJ50_00015 [Synechococcus sp. RSCCF101]|uniref:hypothetical protein n=1 Tax=Synechococcus sp. RSCCF101 TaxID=2511069 RepID=UPI001243D0C5|nr:hypothetical protein [Synechococcus sp. RSCCF101]QEY30883.1 hypothetical protein EVJ50_00015 [Synechococcus sp. RSCCF101]
MRSGARSAALAWGSSQAGSSLSLAATAWLVSGLSRSPLLNGLLPAVVTLPALLPLRPKPSAYGLQLLSLLMLLAASLAGARSLPAQNTVWLIAICFLPACCSGWGGRAVSCLCSSACWSAPAQRLRDSGPQRSWAGCSDCC